MKFSNTDTVNGKSHSYLSFLLDKEMFAIDVMNIIEILEVSHITPVPNAPKYMKGVVNVRGMVLPVVDTRVKFKMSPISLTLNSCIIVLKMNINGAIIHAGALVDSVLEVLEADENQIQPSPSLGAKYKAEFIRGILNVDDKFLMLLEIEEVFNADDQEEIALHSQNNDYTIFN